MSILKIISYPDKRLRKIANPVFFVSNNTKKIIQDMFETMYFHNGIGLAATQVDINQQIFIIDLHKNNQKSLTFINPSIIKKTGLINTEESCLSIPKIHEIVPRYEKITVQSLNEHGELFEIKANNLLSICIQHEIDHLMGKLFIDYLSPVKFKKIHKKIIKLSKTSKNTKLNL